MDERYTRQGRSKVGAGALLISGVALASLAIASSLATRLSPAEAVGALALKLGAMWPALVYIAAAHGMAFPLRRLWAGAADSAPVQFGVGLAVLISLSEILGVLGWLRPPIAIGVCALGLGLALWQLARWAGRREPGIDVSAAWALGAPAGALMLVAAAMPPGWLWASEYGGYDALSYHLQLPQEWLASGRIEPVEHNVYSYLPGYIEAAFVHLGALTLAPGEGLLGGDGWRLLSCQALHAGLTLAAAWLTARATRRFAHTAGCEAAVAGWAGAVAGGLALATPWAVVTGSLAYNEAGVNAMLGAALLVCAQPVLHPAVRGGLVGLLVGVACGFKPTALFFVGVPAGIVLLASCWFSDRRTVVQAVVSGGVAGMIALAPWLIRNTAHGGNPVFPFGADLFGSAHWSAEQLDRYRSAHRFDGSILDRLRTLVWTSPASSEGDPSVVRFRGLANPQWGLLPPLAVASAAVLLMGWREARAIAVLLVLALAAQVAAWLAFTHLQSRFLLPALPIGCVLLGLALARLRGLAEHRPDGRAAAGLLASVLVLAQTAFLLVIYLGERDGSAGSALGAFPEIYTGAGAPEPEETAVGWSHARDANTGSVYLVGDGTPLYFGPGVVYHTTFDRSPLGELMRTHPGEPGAWAGALRDRGVRWMLVNGSELARLQASAWYDPLVTPGAVREFAETRGGAARVWREEARYLVDLGAEPGP